MWRKLVQTNDDVSALVARLALGIVIFPHGAQKLLGWFGGFGFDASMGYFTQTVGVPAVLGFLVIVAEFFGSIALITGFLTRLAAVGVGCVMIGAALLVHWPHGFFMDWAGTMQGEGFEYHILALGLVIVLLVKGAGPLSLDRAWTGGASVLEAAPAEPQLALR